jgi:hypothetical protein
MATWSPANPDPSCPAAVPCRANIQAASPHTVGSITHLPRTELDRVHCCQRPTDADGATIPRAWPWRRYRFGAGVDSRPERPRRGHTESSARAHASESEGSVRLRMARNTIPAPDLGWRPDQRAATRAVADSAARVLECGPITSGGAGALGAADQPQPGSPRVDVICEGTHSARPP